MRDLEKDIDGLEEQLEHLDAHDDSKEMDEAFLTGIILFFRLLDGIRSELQQRNDHEIGN